MSCEAQGSECYAGGRVPDPHLPVHPTPIPRLAAWSSQTPDTAPSGQPAPHNPLSSTSWIGAKPQTQNGIRTTLTSRCVPKGTRSRLTLSQPGVGVQIWLTRVVRPLAAHTFAGGPRNRTSPEYPGAVPHGRTGTNKIKPETGARTDHGHKVDLADVTCAVWHRWWCWGPCWSVVSACQVTDPTEINPYPSCGDHWSALDPSVVVLAAAVPYARRPHYPRQARGYLTLVTFAGLVIAFRRRTVTPAKKSTCCGISGSADGLSCTYP